jgi:hypothetical protein
VRFGISHVLDAIEKKISTDPTETGAVLDLGEVIRLAEVDGGRPAHLVRLGLMIDAISHHLGDDTISVYAVADRSLLADNELTANEKIVIRRWSDDGLVEVVHNGGPSAAARAREIAALTGLPLIARRASGYPGLAYAPTPAGGGVKLIPTMIGPGPAAPAAVLGRQWRCPEPGCASFGPDRAEPGFAGGEPAPPGSRRENAQPPAQLRNGKPFCPRHGAPLTDLGPWPRAVSIAVRIAGLAWHRFTVTEADPVVVGRAPEEPDSVTIGLALDERGLRWVSRSHVRLELRGHRLQATDMSTNGTTMLQRSGPGEEPRRTPLRQGESAPVGEWDTIEVFEGVELARSIRSEGPPPGAPTGSVLTEAPTQAIRLTKD